MNRFGKMLVLLLLLVLLLGCGTKPQSPEQGAPKTKISVLFSEGGRGDLSYNDMAYFGTEQAKADFGEAIDVNYSFCYNQYDQKSRFGSLFYHISCFEK